MCKIERFKTFKEYFDLTEKIKNYNPFLYYHLENSIKKVAKNKEILIDFFFIQENEDYTFCLWNKEECLLYSNNENENFIFKVIEELKFENFKRFRFSGTKNIIENIFSRCDVVSEEVKFRKYYSCKELPNNFEISDGNLAMADFNFLLKLTEFVNKFNDEFYGNEKPGINSKNVIINGIHKNNLLQWEIDSIPVAIIQIDYEEYDFPIIRFVYVEEEFRGKGIGASILYETTKGLLANGHLECMLYTDGNNAYSNNSFQKTGYKLVGEYISKYKIK